MNKFRPCQSHVRLLTSSLRGPRSLPLLRRHQDVAQTSSTAPKEVETNHEWLVILPDQADAAQRRIKFRPQHLEQLSKIYPPDFLLCGGPYLSKPASKGCTMDMLGSILLAWAPSSTAVEAALRNDVFTKCDVWDWENAQILPFRSTIRKSL